VAQDEVGHLDAQLAGFGYAGEALRRRAAVVLEFQYVLVHRKAAFGARDPEFFHEAQPVFPAGEGFFEPRNVFRDDLGDDAVPVERRAVVAHEDFEPGQRGANGFEIAGGGVGHRVPREVRGEGISGDADAFLSPFLREEGKGEGRDRTEPIDGGAVTIAAI
jgi:hypothetical protein